jgi:hypothetical protein
MAGPLGKDITRRSLLKLFGKGAAAATQANPIVNVLTSQLGGQVTGAPIEAALEPIQEVIMKGLVAARNNPKLREYIIKQASNYFQLESHGAEVGSEEQELRDAITKGKITDQGLAVDSKELNKDQVNDVASGLDGYYDDKNQKEGVESDPFVGEGTFEVLHEINTLPPSEREILAEKEWREQNPRYDASGGWLENQRIDEINQQTYPRENTPRENAHLSAHYTDEILDGYGGRKPRTRPYYAGTDELEEEVDRELTEIDIAAAEDGYPVGYGDDPGPIDYLASELDTYFGDKAHREGKVKDGLLIDSFDNPNHQGSNELSEEQRTQRNHATTVASWGGQAGYEKHLRELAQEERDQPLNPGSGTDELKDELHKEGKHYEFDYGAIKRAAEEARRTKKPVTLKPTTAKPRQGQGSPVDLKPFEAKRSKAAGQATRMLADRIPVIKIANAIGKLFKKGKKVTGGIQEVLKNRNKAKPVQQKPLQIEDKRQVPLQTEKPKVEVPIKDDEIPF